MLGHPFENDKAVAVHPRGSSAAWRGQACGETSRLVSRQLRRRRVVVVFGGFFDPVNARSPLDDIEIKFKDALLAQNPIRERGQGVFECFSKRIAMRGEEKILHKLLGDGGGTAADSARFAALLCDLFHLLPIDAMVPVEAAVLCGNHGMLQVWRDFAERNPLLPLVVGRMGDDGFKPPLDLDAGGWRVNVTKRNQGRDPKEVNACNSEERKFEKAINPGSGFRHQSTECRKMGWAGVERFAPLRADDDKSAARCCSLTTTGWGSPAASVGRTVPRVRTARMRSDGVFADSTESTR